MSESLDLSVVLPVTPERLYKAWLDSKEHSAFTGSKAKIAATVGGKYSAWDGYITGETLELDPPRRIVQSWRTTEFPKDSPDSRLEVLFEAEGEGTRLHLIHTGIPDGQAKKYEGGWPEAYFDPMKEYFG